MTATATTAAVAVVVPLLLFVNIIVTDAHNYSTDTGII